MGRSLLHRGPYLGRSQEAPSGRSSFMGRRPRGFLCTGALSGQESGGPSGLLNETLYALS